MFNSYVDYRDLIFQDSTVRLSPIEYENQDFKTFLGESFIRSMERMAGIDLHDYRKHFLGNFNNCKCNSGCSFNCLHATA